MRATIAAAIKRMPLEDALLANSWNGRTILATGRARFTPMPILFPKGATLEPCPVIRRTAEKGWFSATGLPPYGILGNMAMWWCAFFFILGYCTAR